MFYTFYYFWYEKGREGWLLMVMFDDKGLWDFYLGFWVAVGRIENLFICFLQTIIYKLKFSK